MFTWEFLFYCLYLSPISNDPLKSAKNTHLNTFTKPIIQKGNPYPCLKDMMDGNGYTDNECGRIEYSIALIS